MKDLESCAIVRLIYLGVLVPVMYYKHKTRLQLQFNIFNNIFNLIVLLKNLFYSVKIIKACLDFIQGIHT